MDRKHLQDLVKAVDPNEQLDEEVEDFLLSYVDRYIEQLVTGASILAVHRKAPTIDAKDVRIHLERTCNMWIPGFGTDELKPMKRVPVNEAHKQRMALIKKTMKKY